jgi:hypothetical protein
MNKLIVHIHQEKTGLSFIQSMLTLNVETLKDNFFYSNHKSFESVSKGHIVQGHLLSGAFLNNFIFAAE